VDTNNATVRFPSIESALRVINSRQLLKAVMIGQLIETSIVGQGTTIGLVDKDNKPVMDALGRQLQKTIYNTKLNSEVAMANPRNREILTAAIAAYKAGDAAKGSEHINDFLNKVQVSFGVIHQIDQPAPFTGGQFIAGKSELVTTEKGSTVVLNGVMAPKATTAARTNITSFDDLLGEQAAPAEGGDDSELNKLLTPKS
jgi:hypothetical protein